jgi:hypothetical protein
VLAPLFADAAFTGSQHRRKDTVNANPLNSCTGAIRLPNASGGEVQEGDADGAEALPQEGVRPRRAARGGCPAGCRHGPQLPAAEHQGTPFVPAPSGNRAQLVFFPPMGLIAFIFYWMLAFDQGFPFVFWAFCMIFFLRDAGGMRTL